MTVTNNGQRDENHPNRSNFGPPQGRQQVGPETSGVIEESKRQGWGGKLDARAMNGTQV